jgi:hypothetical protein
VDTYDKQHNIKSSFKEMLGTDMLEDQPTFPEVEECLDDIIDQYGDESAELLELLKKCRDKNLENTSHLVILFRLLESSKVRLRNTETGCRKCERLHEKE